MLAHGIHGASSKRALIIAATASATAAASATVRATATTTTSTFAHRSRFIHHQRPTHEFLAVAGLDRPFRGCVVRELGESKAARLTGEFIANDLDRIGMNRRL